MASDILIVDDEADIRELVAGILDDEGFSTRTARDSDSGPAQSVECSPPSAASDWMIRPCAISARSRSAR